MKKLSFDLNRLLADKTEDQRVGLPVEKELNEQELATATGGFWGGGPCGSGFFFHRRVCYSSFESFGGFSGCGGCGGCGGFGGFGGGWGNGCW